MAIAQVHAAFGRIFYQRCFYLFVSLVVLIVAAPHVTETLRGRLVMQVVLLLVMLAIVAMVGRTTLPFVIGLLLGVPAMVLQLLVLLGLADAARLHAVSMALYLAFYVLVVGCLLRYVFSPEVMTEDKLFGAAATYLLLGLLWTAAYELVQFFDPQAFGATNGASPRTFYELLYMSFGLLTSNGPGTLVPVGSKVQTLVILEEVVGTLFVAILIARLAGIYPAKRDSAPAGSEGAAVLSDTGSR